MLTDEEGTAYCRVVEEAHILSLISSHILWRNKFSSLLLEWCSSEHPLTPIREECQSVSSVRADRVGSLHWLGNYRNPSFFLGILWHHPFRSAVTTGWGRLLFLLFSTFSIKVNLIVTRKGWQFLLPSWLLVKRLQCVLVLQNMFHFSDVKM